MLLKITAIILLLVSSNKKHPLYDDSNRAKSVASEIMHAANVSDIDPYLLLAWTWHESAFRPCAVGKLGERGMMQTHGAASRWCKKNGHAPGSIRCGAGLINHGRSVCGDLRRALYWYSSGKCNGTPRAKRIVEYRKRKIKRWKEMKF